MSPWLRPVAQVGWCGFVANDGSLGDPGTTCRRAQYEWSDGSVSCAAIEHEGADTLDVGPSGERLFANDARVTDHFVLRLDDDLHALVEGPRLRWRGAGSATPPGDLLRVVRDRIRATRERLAKLLRIESHLERQDGGLDVDARA